MPLPTLDTQGIDITNTLFKIDQRKQQREDSRMNRETREKQNALLDLQLSPEMQSALKAERDANLATKNANLKRIQVENDMKAAEQVRGQLDALRNSLDDPTGKSYNELYSKIMSNPMLREHGAILPNLEDYYKPDLKSVSGKTLNKETRERLKLRLGNLMTAAERKARGLTNKYVEIYFPDGTAGYYAIPEVPQDPGAEINAANISGVEGATFEKSEKGKDKKYIKVKETKDGKTEEVTYEVDPKTGEKLEFARGDAFKAGKEDDKTEEKLKKLRERRTKLSSELFQMNKYGENPFEDKEGMKAVVDEVNSLNKELGIDEEIVWKDKDDLEKEKEKGAGSKVLEFFGLGGDDSKGGYVRMAKGSKTTSENSDFVEINGKKIPKITDDEGINKLLREAEQAVKDGADVNAVNKRIELLTGQKVKIGKPENR